MKRPCILLLLGFAVPKGPVGCGHEALGAPVSSGREPGVTVQGERHGAVDLFVEEGRDVRERLCCRLLLGRQPHNPPQFPALLPHHDVDQRSVGREL